MPQPTATPITNPADVFPEAVFAILVPILLTACPCDPAAARAATIEAVAAFNPADTCQMVAIAQVLANSLIALDGLRQSVDPDLAIPAKLRLRGNAVALQRANLQAIKSIRTERAPQPPASKPIAQAGEPRHAPTETVPDPATEAPPRLDHKARTPPPRPVQTAKSTPAPTRQEEKLLQLLAQTPPGITPHASALGTAFRPPAGPGPLLAQAT